MNVFLFRPCRLGRIHMARAGAQTADPRCSQHRDNCRHGSLQTWVVGFLHIRVYPSLLLPCFQVKYLHPCLARRCQKPRCSLTGSLLWREYLCSPSRFTRAPLWLSGQRVCLQCRGTVFDPWLGKIPWRRKWHPTPASLPGEFRGQRSRVAYSPWGHKESDTTEWLTLSLSFQDSCYVMVSGRWGLRVEPSEVESVPLWGTYTEPPASVQCTSTVNAHDLEEGPRLTTLALCSRTSSLYNWKTDTVYTPPHLSH